MTINQFSLISNKWIHVKLVKPQSENNFNFFQNISICYSFILSHLFNIRILMNSKNLIKQLSFNLS